MMKECPNHIHVKMSETDNCAVTGSANQLIGSEIKPIFINTMLSEPCCQSSKIPNKSATELIASADAGHTKLIYPTRRNLERLAQFDGFDKAAEAASAHPIETIAPWVEQRAGAPHLCIPEGLGYPITAERLDRAVLG